MGISEGNGSVDVIAAIAASADGHDTASDEFGLVTAEKGGD
jgi:hypothetical protein